MVQSLRTAADQDVLAAAEAALDVVRVEPGRFNGELRKTLDDVMHRLLAAAHQAGREQGERLVTLARRWQAARPSCPHVKELVRVTDLKSAVAATTPG